MSEQIPDHVLKNTKDSLMLIYLIYAAGAFTLGFTTILGVIWTYLEREKVDEVLQSHVSFLFQTFWKSWALMMVGVMLGFFFLGFLIFVLWFFWLLVRCFRGFRALRADQPITNPQRWVF
ncbi:MAG: hypothetical protein KDJ35_03230 [Alphaproteobacteria bacterium]|nr:hypothetical protein [Alphaproteobacteria bacterium]